MIKYKVKARLAKNLGTDEFQLEEFGKTFEDKTNPIQARKEAFQYYKSIIDIVAYGKDDYDIIQTHISENAKQTFFEHNGFKWPMVSEMDNLGIGIYILIKEDFDGLLKDEENMIIGYNQQFDYLSVTHHLESEFSLYKKKGWGTENWEIDLKYFDYEYDEADSEDGVVITKTLFTPFNFWAYHNPSLVDDKEEVDEIIIEEDKLLKQIIEKGENRNVEFKSTFRYCLHKKSAQHYIEFEILKTIAAFANTNGGTLLIGISDDGEILGLENDFNIYKDNPRDKYLKHFANLIGTGFTEPIDAILNYGFEKTINGEIFLVVVQKSKKPRFTHSKSEGKQFFIRRSATSQRLDIEEAVKYSIDNWYARD